MQGRADYLKCMWFAMVRSLCGGIFHEVHRAPSATLAYRKFVNATTEERWHLSSDPSVLRLPDLRLSTPAPR